MYEICVSVIDSDIVKYQKTVFAIFKEKSF